MCAYQPHDRTVERKLFTQPSGLVVIVPSFLIPSCPKALSPHEQTLPLRRSARLWLWPAEIAVTPTSGPGPIEPGEFGPAPQPLSVPITCCGYCEQYVDEEGPGVHVFGEAVLLPMPSSPYVLSPHATTEPPGRPMLFGAPSSARLKESPAEIAVTPLRKGPVAPHGVGPRQTATGAAELATVPIPSSPLLFWPQVTTVPPGRPMLLPAASRAMLWKPRPPIAIAPFRNWFAGLMHAPETGLVGRQTGAGTLTGAPKNTPWPSWP